MIEFVKISDDWNADPVLPEIDLKIKEKDLVLEILLNYYAFDHFSEGDKIQITFSSCSKYSLNTCNDEGYYAGQYRINPSELPWGEFYEIKNGIDRNLPEPVVEITNNITDKRHFIFFFKDETFECLSNDYKIEFISKNGK